MGLLPGFKLTDDEEQHFRRGDIYYVNNGKADHVGSETKKDRPAIVVSCDANNKNSPVLEMVFMTTQPKADLPTHVTIRSTGRVSTALCEAPTPIAVERINNYLGEVTEEEMKRIDIALLIGLGIKNDKQEQEKVEVLSESREMSRQKDENIRKMQEEIEHLKKEISDMQEEILKKTADAATADAERSAYKEMHEKLLKMLMDGRREERKYAV